MKHNSKSQNIFEIKVFFFFILKKKKNKKDIAEKR